MAFHFSIDELLTRLAEAKFTVSVDRRLRAHTLLGILPAGVDRHELRVALRTLFATDEKQQERFDAVFADYVGRLDKPGEVAAVVVVAQGALGPGREEEEREPEKGPRKADLVVAIVAIVAVLSFILLRFWPPPGTPPPGINSTGTAPTSGTDTAIATDTVSTTGTTNTTSTTATTRAEEQKHEREQPDVGWRYLVVAALAFLTVGAAIDGVRWALRRKSVSQIVGCYSPYRWTPQRDPVPEIFDSVNLQQAANALRGRLAGERLEIDVARTIRGTIARAGFPTFHYRGAAQSPEYVALIDRPLPDDLLAAYFEELVEVLREQGAAVDCYFFRNDPRLCATDEGKEVELTRLRRERPSAKLLVFSDGEGLVDAPTGALQPWLARELDWDERALLLPALVSSRRLAALKKHFLVERANAEGLRRLAGAFAGDPPHHDHAPEDHSFSADPDVGELQRSLPADTFRWLITCAAQRALDWNATMALGRLTGALTDQNILDLLRIAWFRRGAIPEHARRQLRALLAADPLLERNTHTAIARELRAVRPPARSFAAEALRVDAIAHEMLARERAEERSPQIEELRLVSASLVRFDDDLPRLLAPTGGAPALWDRLRYRAGFEALGPSRLWTTLLTASLAVVLAGAGGVAEVVKQKEPPVAETAQPLTTETTETTQTTATQAAQTETVTTTVAYSTTIGPPTAPRCRGTLTLAGGDIWTLRLFDCPTVRPIVLDETIRFRSGRLAPVDFIVADGGGAVAFLRMPPNAGGRERALLTQLVQARNVEMVAPAIVPITVSADPSVAAIACVGRLLPQAGSEVWEIELDPCPGAPQFSTRASGELTIGDSVYDVTMRNTTTTPLALTADMSFISDADSNTAYASLGPATPTVVLSFAGRQYRMTVTGWAAPAPAEVLTPLSTTGVSGGSLARLISPINDAIVRVGTSQGVLFRWGAPMVTRDIRISCQESRSPGLVHRASLAPGTYAWNPDPELKGRCTWEAVIVEGSVTRTSNSESFVLDRSRALKTTARRLSTATILVQGEVDDGEGTVEVNSVAVPINAKHEFSHVISAPTSTDIRVVLILPNGAMVFEDLTVP